MSDSESRGVTRWVELADALADLGGEMAVRTTLLATDVPPTIYHYTDVHGLLGIVESNELWASNAVFLNDQTEIQYAADITRSVLNELIPSQRNLSISGPRLMARRSITTVLDNVHDHVQAYVVCFCRQDDLLSQWRGYGRGNGAYSIGFMPDRLLGRSNRQMRLVRVEYRPEVQAATARQLIRDWIDVLTKQEVDTIPSFEGTSEDSVQLLLDHMFGFLFGYIAGTFKHPSFSEEDEYRLTYVYRSRDAADDNDPLKVEFQGKLGIVLPYIRFGFKTVDGLAMPLPIKTIRVGPHPDTQLASSGIQQLLELKYPASSIEVKSSLTPLRS